MDLRPRSGAKSQIEAWQIEPALLETIGSLEVHQQRVAATDLRNFWRPWSGRRGSQDEGSGLITAGLVFDKSVPGWCARKERICRSTYLK